MRKWNLLLILVAGCSPSPPAATQEAPSAEKLGVPGIENVYRVSPTLYSGGSPEGDADFVELKKLGIRTIISVDGMIPDVATAEKHGMKYVHLPVGYDGIPTPTAYKMAKAVQTLPGPVYVHCHHGVHRGPTAVAAIRLCLEPEFTPSDAAAWLHQAGTDAKYHGLISLPATLPRPSASQLAAIPAEFSAEIPANGLKKAMLNVDAHWDTIKAAIKSIVMREVPFSIPGLRFL